MRLNQASHGVHLNPNSILLTSVPDQPPTSTAKNYLGQRLKPVAQERDCLQGRPLSNSENQTVENHT